MPRGQRRARPSSARSVETLAFSFRATGGRTTPRPTGPPRPRARVPTARRHPTRRRRRAGSGARRALRGPPRDGGGVQGLTFRRTTSVEIGTQHTKPTTAGSNVDPNLVRPNRRARDAVAARAGIRRALAGQPPLTCPPARLTETQHAPDRPPTTPLGITRSNRVHDRPNKARRTRKNETERTHRLTDRTCPARTRGRSRSRPTTGRHPRLPSISPSQPTRLAEHPQRPCGHRVSLARHVGRSGSSPGHPVGPSPNFHLTRPHDYTSFPRTTRVSFRKPSNFGSYSAPQRHALASNTPCRAPPTPLRASGKPSSARRVLIGHFAGAPRRTVAGEPPY